jgi:putative acetyltransferase
MFIFKRTTSDDPAFRELIIGLDKYLRSRYGQLQDTYDTHNIIDYIGTVVVAFVDAEPAGCACFKEHDQSTVEVKRMFVADNQRGKGIASRMMDELEKWAGELEYTTMILELGDNQPEAIKLYKGKGYQVTPNYPPYIGMEKSICMKKSLLTLTETNVAGQH